MALPTHERNLWLFALFPGLQDNNYMGEGGLEEPAIMNWIENEEVIIMGLPVVSYYYGSASSKLWRQAVAQRRETTMPCWMQQIDAVCFSGGSLVQQQWKKTFSIWLIKLRYIVFDL